MKERAQAGKKKSTIGGTFTNFRSVEGQKIFFKN